MNLHDPPDAEEITKLGKYFTNERWNKQDLLDDEADSYLLLKNEVEVHRGKEAKVKGYRSGMGGLLVKEDAALLGGLPGLHVNNPDPDDDKLKKHVNELLEPWLVGAWKRSQQAGAVWDRLFQDLRGRGRAWDNILPHPHLWATDDFTEIVDRLEKETVPEAREGLFKKLARLKAEIWPIRWTYVSPRGTWSTFDSEFWLPEVIECRQMRLSDAADRWGEDKIPGDLGKKKSASLIDVLVWANYGYAAVVIPSKADPKLAHSFYHGFRRSPYNVLEAELAPDNDMGVRWLSQIYYARGQLRTLDELYSELRQNLSENARTPRAAFLDRDTYPPDQLENGRPKKLNFEDGAAYWKDEEIRLIPVSVLNPEAAAFLDRVEGQVERTQVRPVTQGKLLSGTSQNAFSTAVQIAERELDPSLRAIADHAESVGQRLFRSVCSLDEEVPVYDALVGKKMIAVGPDDVEGWGWLITAQVDRTIYTDMNLVAATAERKAGLGVSRETIFEQDFKYGDPQGELRKGREEQLDEAIWQGVVIPAAQQWLMSGGEPTPELLSRVQALIGGASPDLQQFAAQMEQQNGAQPSIAASNEARAGITQQPQMPQEPTIAPPTVNPGV